MAKKAWTHSLARLGLSEFAVLVRMISAVCKKVIFLVGLDSSGWVS